jgi:hypothetical protein
LTRCAFAAEPDGGWIGPREHVFVTMNFSHVPVWLVVSTPLQNISQWEGLFSFHFQMLQESLLG